MTRARCGFIPPTAGYGPCTRPPHKTGPCAHEPAAVTAGFYPTIDYFAAGEFPALFVARCEDGIVAGTADFWGRLLGLPDGAGGASAPLLTPTRLHRRLQAMGIR